MSENGNGAVPPEPPAGATAQPDVLRPPKADPEGYKQKLCPILSAPMMKPGVEAVQVASCKGPLCMFFVPITEQTANGPKLIDGQCAIALFPTSISMMTNTMVMIEQNRAQQQRPLVQASHLKNLKR